MPRSCRVPPPEHRAELTAPGRGCGSEMPRHFSLLVDNLDRVINSSLEDDRHIAYPFAALATVMLALLHEAELESRAVMPPGTRRLERLLLDHLRQAARAMRAIKNLENPENAKPKHLGQK